MSSEVYITAKAHIVRDSKAAEDLVERATQVFTGSSWDVDEHWSNVEEGECFTEIETKVFGFGASEALSSIEEVLEKTAFLRNGSYGLLISESDFGVEGYDCYGDVKLAEVDDAGEGVVWASEDFLNLVFTMEAGEWREVLGCDIESLTNEIDSQGDELLLRLLPASFLRACEKDGDVAFQYRETDPYKLEGESFDEHEDVDVIFELDGHDLKRETFDAIVKAVNFTSDEMSAPASKPLIRLDNATEKEGMYESRMVDINAYAMLVFKSSRDGITDVKFLKPLVGER